MEELHEFGDETTEFLDLLDGLEASFDKETSILDSNIREAFIFRGKLFSAIHAIDRYLLRIKASPPNKTSIVVLDEFADLPGDKSEKAK